MVANTTILVEALRLLKVRVLDLAPARKVKTVDRWSTLLGAITLQYLAVFLGIIWSKAERASLTPDWNMESCAAHLSILILGISTYRARARRRFQEPSCSRLLLGLTIYAVIAVHSNLGSPVWWGGIAMVLVPFFGFKPLIRHNEWLAVLGLFVLSTALTAYLLSFGRMNINGAIYSE